MTALPAEIQYGKVVGRFLLAIGDAGDADRNPDAQAAVGTVTFTPKNVVTKTTTPAPATVIKQKIVSAIDNDGYVLDRPAKTDPGAQVGVWLVTGVYTVGYTFAGASLPSHDIEVLSTHTDAAPLDLTTAIPPGGPILSASEYAELSSRVDALEAAPPGSAPDATTTTKGIVKLAGDLGGTADLPTVPGLAGKAPTSHTHTLDQTTDTATRLALTPAERTKLTNTSGTNTGDQVLPTWSTISGKPAVVAAGATQADARTSIGAGTSSLALGTTAGTALDASTAPELIRDTMGTALVAGTNVTITPNDAGDTITIAAAGGSGTPGRYVGVNAQTGTTYTPVLTDEGKLVTLTNAAAITVTLPQDSALAFPVGGRIDFAGMGAGLATFVAGTGATVNGTPSLVQRAQYGAFTAIKVAANTWLVVGDLA